MGHHRCVGSVWASCCLLQHRVCGVSITFAGVGCVCSVGRCLCPGSEVLMLQGGWPLSPNTRDRVATQPHNYREGGGLCLWQVPHLTRWQQALPGLGPYCLGWGSLGGERMPRSLPAPSFIPVPALFPQLGVRGRGLSSRLGCGLRKEAVFACSFACSPFKAKCSET